MPYTPRHSGNRDTTSETRLVTHPRLSTATTVSRRAALRLLGTTGVVAAIAACRRPGFLGRPEPTPEVKDLNLLVAEEYLFLLEFETLEGPWSEAYPYWPLVVHESDLDGLFGRASQAAADGSGAYDGILPIAMPIETQNWLDFELIQPWDAHLEEGGLPGGDRIMEGMDVSVREAARARGQQMGLPINVSSIALAWLNAPMEAAGMAGRSGHLGRHDAGRPGHQAVFDTDPVRPGFQPPVGPGGHDLERRGKTPTRPMTTSSGTGKWRPWRSTGSRKWF